MPTLYAVLMEPISLFIEFLVLPRAYQMYVGFSTFLNVSHIKMNNEGIRVADFLLFAIRLAINCHGMAFVIFFFLSRM